MISTNPAATSVITVITGMRMMAGGEEIFRQCFVCRLRPVFLYVPVITAAAVLTDRRKDVMKRFSGAAAAAICLFGALMPMASAGAYYVNVSHLGGITYLIYPLALAALSLAVLSTIHTGNRNLVLWLRIVAVTGIVLSAVAVSGAKNHLAYMLASMSRFSSLIASGSGQTAVSQASIGTGGLMSLAGYAGLLVSGFLPNISDEDNGGAR